jgi:tetratricopeptide (TPR) repeat protein
VKRGFVVSAIFGAAGLWISAVSQTLVLAAAVIGVLLSLRFLSRQATRAGLQYQPGFWRICGRIGATGSLVFWLLEYFPNWMGMRLEINHPLYALGWWCAGEIMEPLCLWCVQPNATPTPFPWRRILAWTPGILALPLAIVFAGARWYAPTDHFLLEIHRHILEFQSITDRVEFGASAWDLLGAHYLLLLPLAVLLILLPRCAASARILLLSLLIPALLLLGLSCYQSRWNLLVGVPYVMLLAFLPACVRTVLPSGKFGTLFYQATVVFLAAGVLTLDAGDELVARWDLATTSRNAIQEPERLHLLHRELARFIRDRAKDRQVTIFSGPNTSLLLGCFGGFNSIDTLYWEDCAGLRAAADICAQTDDDAALKMLMQRRVTHVVYLGWEQELIAQYLQLIHPQWTERQQADTFAARSLFSRSLPSWLRPLPLPATPLRTGLKMDVMVAEVVPEQTPAEAALHLGHWLVSENRLPDALQAYRQALNLDPSLVEARFALAVTLACSGSQEIAGRDLLHLLDSLPMQRRNALETQAAMQLASTGRGDLAVALLRSVLARDPAEPLAMLNLCSLLAANPDAATEVLDLAERLRARPRMKDSPKVQLLYAVALQMTGHRQEAYQELQRARRLSQQNADAIAPAVLDLLQSNMVPPPQQP